MDMDWSNIRDLICAILVAVFRNETRFALEAAGAYPARETPSTADYQCRRHTPRNAIHPAERIDYNSPVKINDLLSRTHVPFIVGRYTVR